MEVDFKVQEIMNKIDAACTLGMTAEETKDFLEELATEIDGRISVLEDEMREAEEEAEREREAEEEAEQEQEAEEREEVDEKE